MILLDVFLMLSIILDSLLLREIGGEGLIENHITDIFLIGQHGFDGTLRPSRFSPGSQNTFFFQILLNPSHTISIQIHLKYLAYYLCLRLVDHQAAIFGFIWKKEREDILKSRLHILSLINPSPNIIFSLAFSGITIEVFSLFSTREMLLMNFSCRESSAASSLYSFFSQSETTRTTSASS